MQFNAVQPFPRVHHFSFTLSLASSYSPSSLLFSSASCFSENSENCPDEKQRIKANIDEVQNVHTLYTVKLLDQRSSTSSSLPAQEHTPLPDEYPENMQLQTADISKLRTKSNVSLDLQHSCSNT